MLVYSAAAVALVGLILYVVLGGADFGGGVLDLFAQGPRKHDQRDAIAHAMGPVWEANHVWLIFVLVVLFTCFPRGYRALSVALFLPFHLALLGIMLRGAAFVFRGYSRAGGKHASMWSVVFGIASIITPFLLGASFAALTGGNVRVDIEGDVRVWFIRPQPWLSRYAIGCGMLAVSTCTYLAAVYLTGETEGELREIFRRRAILAGTTTAILAGEVLYLGQEHARWFVDQLLNQNSAPVVITGLVFFAASAWAVFTRRYRLSRLFAATEIALLLIGWGLAHQPYLIYPDLTLFDAAGPASTIRFLLWSLPVGAALLIPSLLLLFRVFKA
jgi:cytochrome d ubiquinol oxidase subunit II